jgi:hypothetical protein
MFPQLRSLKPEQLSVPAEILGAFGGPMDGGAGIDPTQDNPALSAGFTFLGQFIDHDITFDPTSSLERQNDPEATRNFRTPYLELDSVYGAGPAAQPYLYEGFTPRREIGKFLISEGDLLRNSRGTAIIGDPRNDENLIVSQLHFAVQRFHNAVWEEHSGRNFEEAQRLVRWHYQWIILHEFLRKTVGDSAVDTVLASGRRFFDFEEEPFIPVEFAVAAYRFGHSQIRPGYSINAGFGASLFPQQPDAPFPNADLRGGQPVSPDRRVDWSRFFGPSAAPGKHIDSQLSSPLLRLPDSVVGPTLPDADRSLAIRNLKRGMMFSLPSGQTVSSFMGIEPLSDAELWDGVPDGSGEAPLWFYILKEAEVRGQGERLDGVGAIIVAEVLIGLLQGDTASFLNQQPGWSPTLPAAIPGTFTMSDLLNVAGLMGATA